MISTIIQYNIERRKDVCLKLEKADMSSYQDTLHQAFILEIYMLENQLKTTENL